MVSIMALAMRLFASVLGFPPWRAPRPAMRRQDQPAEHGGVGSWIYMPGTLRLLDKLAAAVQ